MLEAGIDYKKINRIFITHRHPDHCSDLIPFLFGTNYSPGIERTAPLSIYAPKGFKSVIEKIYDLFPWTAPKKYKIKIQELNEEALQLDGAILKSKPILHGDLAALSYRLEVGGKAIVYSGDVAYCQALIDHANQADLLIIECSFPEGAGLPGVHLNSIDVGKIAEAAKARRVILTHLNPVCDESNLIGQVKKVYSGFVEKGEDLMRISL